MKNRVELWLRVGTLLGGAVFAASGIVFWHNSHGVPTFAVLVGLFSASWALVGLRRWLDFAVSVGHIALGATSLVFGFSLSLPALIWAGVFMAVAGGRAVASWRKGDAGSREQRPKTETLSHTFLDN